MFFRATQVYSVKSDFALFVSTGLNLGLLGLDTHSLKVLIDAGKDKQKKAAKVVLPLRKRGNLLLCTLLLSNVLVNAVLAVISARLFGDGIGTLIATALITLFGEIIPQAICNRYGLYVGAVATPAVWICLICLLPITLPLALCLNFLLGEEIGTVYSRSELKQLLDYHSTLPSKTSDFTAPEVKMLSSAIDFQAKTVSMVMTQLKDVFMMSIDSVLDTRTMCQLMETGHSRIPVYSGARTNIVGIIVVKDLIILSPEHAIPLRNLMGIIGRTPIETHSDERLTELMNTFKSGQAHIAVVKDVVVDPDGDADPQYVLRGIVTMEDVIEALLNTEIADETDKVELDDMGMVHYNAIERTRHEDLRQLAFAHRRSDFNLTHAQAKATAAFLRDTYPDLFGPNQFSATPLESFVRSGMVVDTKKLTVAGCQRLSENHTTVTRLDLSEMTDDPESIAADVELYTLGKPNCHFTIVLQGEVNVRFGRDGFVAALKPWNVLGLEAIEGTESTFEPTFTARTNGAVQYVTFTRSTYLRYRDMMDDAIADVGVDVSLVGDE
ncbi:DUF21-domain-containing protein [Carpediemonas membranifera]|uniref:DUF21-domain-containing protein n=2 Tax=Carpediemonas membranifera TaxID=201153 RepID=A0A8J6B068_9EUKA|nr:DUF21-domain-containing protein [Carpediemonas membranifera]|eukprot:KAG9392688.1 DUF21-domain-containing protein [Carpediemonas membranifera]